MKNGLLKGAMALSLLGAGVVAADTLAQPTTAQASVKSVKYTNIKDTKVHVSSGYMYTSAKLTKKAHNAKNYKYTTFTRTEQATVKKSNGKTAVYQYIKAGSVKGWIWHSYVKSGVAPANVQTYATKMSSYVSGTNVNDGDSFGSVDSFYSLGADLIYNAGSVYFISSSEYEKDLTAFSNIANLLKSKFSSSTNSAISSMISKAKSETFTDDNSGTLEDELSNISETIGAALEAL